MQWNEQLNEIMYFNVATRPTYSSNHYLIQPKAYFNYSSHSDEVEKEYLRLPPNFQQHTEAKLSNRKIDSSIVRPKSGKVNRLSNVGIIDPIPQQHKTKNSYLAFPRTQRCNINP